MPSTPPSALLSAPPARCMRAPTRIDFGGGWTDVPPYPERDGGFVCNLAIARYASARVLPLAAAAGTTAGTAGVGDRALVAAALRRHHAADVAVSLHNDFPVGAGLGGSSAAGVATAAALAAWRGDDTRSDDARAALAERSRTVEIEELGIAGGRQDHYAAAFGGALALRFGAAVTVERIALSASLRAELERRCLLIYTGESRMSGGTITAVLDAYEARESRVVLALRRMRELGERMADALRAADVDALAALVGEHWAHQRSLHPAIPTARIDRIVERARDAGARGAKAMGASGGGCVLVIAGPTEDDAARARAAIAPMGELLPFTIDDAGVAPCP